MKNFLTTAAGLMAVGSLSSADPSDNEWTGLDSEIKSIASSIAPNDNGIGMAAMLRFDYAFASDDISTGSSDGAPDVSGFRFDDIDLAFWTNIGDYTMRVSFDLAGNVEDTSDGAEVQDAYVHWKCPTDLGISAGRMNPSFLHDANVHPENLFFMDRTAIGSLTYGYDEGMQVSGKVQDIGWSAGLFNGSTDENSDHRYFLRGEYHLGEGAGAMEGPHEKPAGTNLTAGLGISIDNTIRGGDTMLVGLDVNGNHDQFGFNFTYLMIDDFEQAPSGFGETAEGFGVIASPLQFVGDSNPHSLAVTYSVNPDWAVGIRSESLDNGDNDGPDNDLLTLGVNYYGAGHGARWSANFTQVNAESDFDDGSYFQIGYVMGFSK